MEAISEKINESKVDNLIRLQSDELEKKNRVIAAMEAMLEEQARKLTLNRHELNVCRSQLMTMRVAV